MICRECRQPLEKWEAGFCEGCGAMTENQRMLLNMVKTRPGEWVSVRGVCLAGQFSGRGIPQVVAGLVKLGLIEESFRQLDDGPRRRLHRCIRLK